jgi:hypothetical protein
VENGQGSLSALLASLGRLNTSVFVRVACGSGRRPVWHVDATIGPPEMPAGWRSQIWDYEAATFVAARTTSAALAAALDPDDAQVLDLGPFAVTLPVLAEQLTLWHKPSRARYDSVALPWPTMIFEVNQQDRPYRQGPPGYLIGEDCPSFFSYDRAFRAFFYGDFAPTPGRQVPSDAAVIRLVDSRAWLDRVVITPTHLDVLVGGNGACGARVELNGTTYRTDARVGDAGEVRLGLPDGLPAGSWLYR